MWNGEYVSRKLGLVIPDDQPNFKELLGIALRKNPKRAHLLVSKVLGKHIPVEPDVAINAANTMADQIAETADTSKALTVFGYAETATCLGALVADRLLDTHDVSYIHSTRYPIHGSVEYGSFEEAHSHATSHHITPNDSMILDDTNRDIVLVDDELTTGNTIMNTIRLFESHKHHEHYYIATLTDMRTTAAMANFAKFEAELGITVTVVSLLSTELTVPVGSVSIAGILIAQLKTLPDLSSNLQGETSFRHHTHKTPLASLGLDSKDFVSLHATAASIGDSIPLESNSKVLVLGLEEDMFLSLLVAEKIRARGIEADFSSTTRSPVITFDDPSYAIKNRIRYTVKDDEAPRYDYNIHEKDYKKVIIVTNEEELGRSDDLIDTLNKEFNEVHIALIEDLNNQLAEPLTAETGFSSYSSKDVKWLLKDLSDVELEAPLEEREENVQSGAAHYAESLPIEYLPTDEYQELFVESLQMNKTKLAEAVGLVSERIYELRESSPVLVSLARGGTPVGALIKRYLEKAYKKEIPHYSISIVRGKGIDINALKYIATHHDPSQVMFVDGWTGKGAITNELNSALSQLFGDTGMHFNSELAVLADPGSCTSVYGTREDYLIPSACLNSTVSGLVSRTVLNDQFIGENDYHGAKFYPHFVNEDKSNLFLDEVSDEFTNDLFMYCSAKNATTVGDKPDWSGWKAVEALKEEFNLPHVNLVKPGVGETTRVLLRRIPWLILVNPAATHSLSHILMLAKERNVQVVEREGLPYSCVGIIKPLQ